VDPLRIGLALLVAAFAVGGALLAARHSESNSSSGEDQRTNAELSSRTNPLLIPINGSRVFVYGGYADSGDFVALNDAAVVDISSGSAELVGESPLPTGLTVPVTGAAVGDAVVIFGTLCSAIIPEDPMGSCEPGTYGAAQYSLGDQSWSSVTVPEELAAVEFGRRHVVGATSDGRVVVLVTNAGNQEQFMTYRPSNRSWETLPPLSINANRPCMAGDTIVVASSALEDADPGAVPGGPEEREAARPYLSLLTLSEASPRWRITPSAPQGVQWEMPMLECLDNAALTWSGSLDTPAIHPVGSDAVNRGWAVLESPPDGIYLDVLWTGREVVAFDESGGLVGAGPSRALDVSSRNWREIPTPEEALDRPVAVDGRVVGWSESAGSDVLVAEVPR
jgi:hypothetical protein